LQRIIKQTLEKQYHAATFKGKIRAPFSKSYTQRAIAIALLAQGETVILNPAMCNDTMAALEIAKGLGASVEFEKDKIRIKGNLKLVSNELSAGESGLSVRMFAPIAALLENEITVTGEGSLLKRPVSMTEGPLISLGADAKSNNGYLPMQIKGPLLGGNATIDGGISSQLLTGLLIALPRVKNDSRLYVNDLQSIPYIDMTLEVMGHFGVKVENHDYRKFIIKGNQSYTSSIYAIEGDWSNASFLLVGGAISGHVEVLGLNSRSRQADIAILKALQLAGAFLNVTDKSIIVKKTNLVGFEFDATHCPDLFPPLVILAVACNGITTIKGAHRLLFKESNRAYVLQMELAKIGVKIELRDDRMIVFGGIVNGGTIDSSNDHRIAMAAALASLISKYPVTIQRAQAVNKSYPEFYSDFEKLAKPSSTHEMQ
jgi:3-phosphoshikimate 1-carboxyvinyltransferase